MLPCHRPCPKKMTWEVVGQEEIFSFTVDLLRYSTVMGNGKRAVSRIHKRNNYGWVTSGACL